MHKTVIGRVDRIDLPEFGLTEINAKIDTGANRSSIHCSQIEEHRDNGVDEITFHIPLDNSMGTNVFHTTDYFKKNIRSSSGHIKERYVIKTTVVLFGRRIKTTVSLSDRREMKYPILLGRKLLKGKFVVDVIEENLSHKAKNK